ncbi:zf-HC2 domain-containing protein [Sphingomonas oryzagri]|uniref:Zf-HC2 domain-containing protein n=1 Tax=Sphingomonas oryzagri TaxID=3042314 RepID=A0ABT6N0F7_9SPHN|nr:zf-HC2 domain-containing protein [Sphingomonas oryzagri]MDH7638789.1 zf-HC2 domain-containing protein [Sphingomonas oryzagri]
MDETRIIAWVDGELSPEEAAEVEAAVAADPALAAIAARHRKIRARFAAAFTPLLNEPVAMPKRRSARIVSLAAVREERAAPPSPPAPRWRSWAWPSAVAASLLVGVIVGQGQQTGGVADRGDALALSAPIAQALDTQSSGQLAPVSVAVSFKDHDGRYCRGFVAQYIGGVACKEAGGWQLRYAAPVDPQKGDYRQAGGDAASAKVIATMIAGDPLDAAGERKAIAAKWR